MGFSQVKCYEDNPIKLWSIEDTSVKPAKQAKLKGYLQQWTKAKCLLGCAFFVDLLIPISALSKTLQSDEIHILEALTGILRTLKELDKLLSKPVGQWATYKNVLQKCEDEVYQLQELKNFSAAKQYFENNGNNYCKKASDCVKSRLKWSDIDMMRSMIAVLNLQGWEKLMNDGFDQQPCAKIQDSS